MNCFVCGLNVQIADSYEFSPDLTGLEPAGAEEARIRNIAGFSHDLIRTLTDIAEAERSAIEASEAAHGESGYSN